MAGDDLPEYIRASEIAKVLGVTRQTVYNWLHRGHIPCRRLPSGRYLIRRDVLDSIKDALRDESDLVAM